MCMNVMAQQHNGKMTLQARMLAESQQADLTKTSRAAKQTMETVIKLDEATAEATIEQLKAAGLTLHSRIGQQVSATMPLSACEEVEQMPGVLRIATHELLPRFMSDVTRKEIRSSEIDGEQGFIGKQPYTGKGVTICMIDAGFDFQHPAFYDEQGRSRIKAVYMPFTENGKKVTFDGITLPGSVYDTPEEIAQLTTDITEMYHGTHTAAIAAGTRSPQGFGGVAPDADLVICCSNASNGDIGVPLSEVISTEGIFHSLAFAGQYAKQLSQRMVVSASLGINHGSHNGKGVMTEAFEALCQQGIPVVLSAGNEGDEKITLHKVFESDDDVLHGFMSAGISIMEGYTHADVPLSIQVSLVKQEPSESFMDDDVYNTIWESPMLDEKSGALFNLKSSDDENLSEGFTGEISIGVLKGEEGTQLAFYYTGEFSDMHYFDVCIRSKQGTDLYLFSAKLSSHSKDGYSDSEPFMTLNDWTTAPDVISVGAYCANDIKRLLTEEEEDTNNTLGDIAEFSSYGTGFNGVHCPTLSAPGVNIVSAVSHYSIEAGMQDDDDDDEGYDDDEDNNEENDGFGNDEDSDSDDDADDGEDDDDDGDSSSTQFREEMMWKGFHYTAEEGTSQAAPAVSGTIALWLEADPTLTIAQIKDIISQSCHTDQYTEASPDRFGLGKLDAKKGLELVLEGASTGIRQVTNEQETPDKRVFMLDGRQVFSTPAHGLYIIGGKKVVVK